MLCWLPLPKPNGREIMTSEQHKIGTVAGMDLYDDHDEDNAMLALRRDRELGWVVDEMNIGEDLPIGGGPPLRRASRKPTRAATQAEKAGTET